MGNSTSKPDAKKKKKGTVGDKWYDPETKRVIYWLISQPIDFFGRHVYLLILSFLRKFSLQELVQRLPKMVSIRDCMPVADAMGKKGKCTNLEFRWRVSKASDRCKP